MFGTNEFGVGAFGTVPFGAGAFGDGAFSRFPRGMTFLKDFSDNNLTADFSKGSPNAIFARVGGATKPATYFDSSGVMQKTITTDDPRFTYGYYDTSGWNAFTQRGLIVEGESINYIKQSIFAADGNSDGIADNWNEFTDVNGTPTQVLVDVSSTFNVGTTVQAEHLVYTGNAGDSNDTYNFYADSTAAASFAKDDEVTISVWIKGETTAGNLKIGFREFDSGATGGTNHFSADIKDSLSTTEWRRFTYSATCVDDAPNACDNLLASVKFDADIDANETFDIYVACFQVEKLPFATTFIPTTTAALTRNLETLKYVTSGNRTAATESCVVKVAPEYANSVSGTKRMLDSDTERRTFNFGSSNDVSVYANLQDGGDSFVDDMINDSWVADTEFTLGYNVQSGISPYVAGFVDGIADGTNDTTDDFAANAWGTYWWLGSDKDEANHFNGTIFSIAFFDNVLTSAQHLYLHNLNWNV